jgi:uncharacterized integral membrane protein (TIGR00698 family)
VNTTQTRQPRAPAWSPVACYAAAAVVAVLISTWVTLVGPILIALALGVLCANLLGPDIAARLGDQKVTQVVLRVGVALLGLRLPLSDLAAIGVRGAVIVIGVVSITFATTCIVGRRLGLDTGLVVLIAAGFSVCGAAAIAAIESSVRRRPADVATAIALVTIFGTVMILVIPLSASALGLSELQAGVWAGASIHEVAQVVAAASLAGPGALAAASTIKLARVSLLGGVFIASRVLAGETSATAKAPLVPWFVWCFVLTAALRTSGIVPGGMLDIANVVTNGLLAAAMFGLGLTITLAALCRVERRAMWLALFATLVAALTSLSAVLLLFP